ncbi:hypothetical protein Q8A73_006503 [Channa argus]|nr:hypothetical protein Q8A73_006503 [Channa argus]
MRWFSWLFTLWTSSALSLLLVGLVGRQVGLQGVETVTCSRWGPPSNQSLFQDGDVIFGGLFNLHYQTPALDHNFTQLLHFKPCTGLEYAPLQYMYAMVFALDEINDNPTLLPGLKLGYHMFDCCSRPPWAPQAALSLAGGDSVSCNLSDDSGGYEEEANDHPVPLIIGAVSSVTAEILSRILGPLSVPLISYLATCSCLSDRVQFPNFFRTIPSDTYQARAFAQLAIRFNWTWIGAVITDNNYGFTAIKIFQEETQGAGLCLEFIETLNRENIVSDAKRAALTIQASTARVILVVTWYTDVRELFLQLAKINVTDRQFVASEAWSTSSDLLQHPVTRKVASGVLGVAIKSSTIPGFENYLKSLNPFHRPSDGFLREFWEVEFGCSPGATNLHSYSSSSLKSLTSTKRTSHPSNISTSPPADKESLERVHNVFTDVSQLRVSYNVYLAVYAAAHALHSLLSCPADNSSTCSSPEHIKPTELLQHLNKVNFTTPQGEEFYFQDGDIPAQYDLVNWQNTPEGTLQLVLVGHVVGFDLHLNESAIQWSTGSRQVLFTVINVH